MIDPQKFADFSTKLAVNRLMVLSDPEPHLNQMSDEISRLRKVIDDLEYALSSDAAMDWVVDSALPIEPLNLQGEALIRCNKALAVIRKYRRNNS